MVEQEIRFCAAPDGTRLAYAVHGCGPPLVKPANWLTHLEFDRESPVWRHWIEALGHGFTLVRYDERGCGLSDREIGELSVERWVEDLESVVDAAGLERFSLLGISQGASIAVVYAARHPERVDRIVLYGGYARGRRHRGAQARLEQEALVAAIRAGWNDPNPAFRRVFTMRFLPDGDDEQMAWYDELQKRSTSAENAAALYDARSDLEVSDVLPRVRAATLVAHARGDLVVPYEEGLRIASAMPNAQLLPLESNNHILLASDPGWRVFIAELHSFLGSPAPAPPIEALSNREHEVMALVAQGLSNEEIAARLVLSVRTVERHLSNVYVKLRVSGKAARAAAAARFIQVG